MGQVTSTINVGGNAEEKLRRIGEAIERVNVAFAQFALQAPSVAAGLGSISAALTGINPELGTMGTRSNTLNKVLTDLNPQLDTATANFEEFSTEATTAAASLSKFENLNGTIKPISMEVNAIGRAASSSAKSTNLLITKLRRLASIYLGVMGTKAMISASDELTSANNKFTTYGTQKFGMDSATAAQFSSETMDKIFNAAQASASSYTGMMSNVAKSVTLAGKAFGKTSKQQIDNAIKFQEIMAKSYALGGASAAEQASSMYQMVQALGSGVLQGDELRSVREGAPLAYQAIEQFAQGVLHTDDSLKELASDGMITSDLVVAAILDMEKKTSKAFNNIDMTFDQIWTRFKNDALKAFQPFLEKLREIANSDSFQFLVSKITNAVYKLGVVLTWLGDQVQTVVDWMAANWETLSTVLETLGVIIAGFVVGKLAYMLVMFVANNWAVLLFVAGVVLLVQWLLKLGFTGGQILGAICGGLAFLGSILVDILLVAIASILTVFIGVTTGVILAIQMIVQIVLWLVLSIVSAAMIIGTAFGTLKDTIIGAFEIAMATAVNKVSSGAIKILNILSKLASAIDNIFGTNLSGGIDGLISKVEGISTSIQETLTKDAVNRKQNVDDAWSNTMTTLGDMWAGRGKYDDWNITDNMANVKNGATDLLTGVWDLADKWSFDPMESFKNGYDFGNNLGNSFDNFMDNFQFTAPEATAGLDLTGFDDIGKGVDDIAKNTGKTAKNTETSEEDLKYLRQIAERQAINRFTTAEINVEMNNNNTMNNMGDLDGIVTHLSTKLREELNVVANGVHKV